MDYSKMTKEELIKILEVRDRKPANNSSNVYELVKQYGLKDQEYFLLITLDGNLNAIKVHEITKGLVNRTLAHPREVFRPAIKDNATSIIVAHNHPSDNLTPSQEDRELTDRLVKAGRVVGIPLVDHIILGIDNYLSLRENGDIFFD